MDQAAAARLDVEAATSVSAKFALDTPAHRRDLADLRAAQSAAEYEFAPCRFDLRAQFGFARDDARANQGLAFPDGRGVGAMVVAKPLERSDHRPPLTPSPPPQTHLARLALPP